MRCEICGKDMLYETLGTSKELDYYTQSKGVCYTCKKLNSEEREKIKRNYHKKKILRNSFIILAICILITLIPLFNLYSEYKYDQRRLENICYSLSNYSSIIKNYEFIDGYDMKLNIELYDDFENLTYQEKFENIEGILNSKEKMSYGLQEADIKFYTSSHTYAMVYNTLFRDDKTYKKEDANFEYYSTFIKKLNFDDTDKLIAMLESMKYSDGIIEFCEEASAVEHFKEEIIYRYALYLLEEKDILEAKKYFETIKDYEGIKKEDIQKFKYAGTWENKNAKGTDYYKAIITGKNIYLFYRKQYTIGNFYSRYNYEIKDSNLILEPKDSLDSQKTFTINNDVLTLKEEIYGFNKLAVRVLEDTKYFQFEKTDENAIPPVSTTPSKKEPSIGMSKSEVETSTWGAPIRKTKTTTAHTVSEMWVYPNSKYIHFEDGYVTAISEY